MESAPFLRIAVISTTLEFTLFKCWYPLASFIAGDSYVYLQSAVYNSRINTYPVGYSCFLRIFSTFTSSDLALVAFQYFAIEASALTLLFTLFGIYSPRRLTRWLMFSLVVFNPVFLYVANYVSSDALFLVLSLLWLTSLLRLLERPGVKLFVIHVLILLYAFSVRYNALYYPAISVIGFIIARQPLKTRLKATLLTVAPVIIYIFYIVHLYQQFCGIRQFTPFTGWQLANNALYAYRYVYDQQVKTPPTALQPLDNMVRHYFDTTKDALRHPSEMLRASTIYMWDPQSPLQKFMDLYTHKDSATGIFKRWSLMGPLYTHYGTWLIQQYPEAYLKFYLLQNAIKFYTPPGEFLDQYNMGRDTISPIAQAWFRYPSKKVAPTFGDYKVRTLGYMPILSGILNFVFLLGYIGLVFLSGPALHKLQYKVYFLFFCFWIANFFFSVVAAPVTLRYQLFGILTAGYFALLITERLYLLSFPRLNIPRSDSDSDRA